MAKSAYFLVYHPKIGSPERVRRFLTSRPEVLSVSSYLPQTFLIVSDVTAGRLTDVFRKFTADQGRFIIIDTGLESNGWLPKAAWDIIRNPEDA